MYFVILGTRPVVCCRLANWLGLADELLQECLAAYMLFLQDTVRPWQQ